uniref:tRNA(Ile)-lysidine synthase, chloroplastic n=1 Tax=Caloglossa beccarii TaxID=131038 RepID=A0A1Z1M814_9FLOR|nr:tRNA Ile-lysidine synthetase [Caloglossa beccarii]ARW62227.1 tRNA Ile-lysidine synthetase [Caloglossa beccarii]
MQKYFNNLINHIIDKYEIKSILVAISGGQDSMCLIQLCESFNSLYKHQINTFEYIYVDHQWRIDSEKHINHLINYFKNIKKKIHIYQIFNLTSSEHISRQYRYHIILKHAKINKHKAILTAHTETDKIETFLLNLIRGTTIEGITSLNLHKKLSYNLNLFRPLINQNRINIHFFCKRWFLPFWSDITNYNQYIKRNRIRNEALPYLQQYFNYNVKYQFIKFLKTCYYDNEYIKQKVMKLYIYIKSNYYTAINIHILRKEHLSVQTRILQLFIFHNFYIIINQKTLLKIINHINAKNKQYFLPTTMTYNNINLYFDEKWLYIILKE